jgi:hypothetical protein
MPITQISTTELDSRIQKGRGLIKRLFKNRPEEIPLGKDFQGEIQIESEKGKEFFYAIFPNLNKLIMYDPSSKRTFYVPLSYNPNHKNGYFDETNLRHLVEVSKDVYKNLEEGIDDSVQ